MATRAQPRRAGAGAADEAHGPEPAAAGEIVRNERRRHRFAIRHPHGHREEPSAVIARELARSRRYGHPMALIGIAPPIRRASSNEDAAATIRGHVRAIDTVWASDAGVFVLLPESDCSDAEALLSRLRMKADPAFAGAVTHIAAFPAGGLTAAALVEIARGTTDGSPTSVWDAALEHRPVRRLVTSDPPSV